MKKLFLILVTILLVNAGCTQTPTQNKNANLETKEKIDLSIDTQDEAIAQAKKISTGLESFSKKYEKFGEIHSSAKFQEEKKYWFIWFWADNTIDLWYIIHLSPEGTVLYEGAEAGG